MHPLPSLLARLFFQCATQYRTQMLVPVEQLREVRDEFQRQVWLPPPLPSACPLMAISLRRTATGQSHKFTHDFMNMRRWYVSIRWLGLFAQLEEGLTGGPNKSTSLMMLPTMVDVLPSG